MSGYRVSFAVTTRQVFALLLTGCAMTYAPPPPSQPRPAQSVMASFDRTWEAVIEFFSEAGIGIKTLEKVSGLIVAEPTSPSEEMADCGGSEWGTVRPTQASFNVFVRGTADTATVKVSAHFVAVLDGPVGTSTFPCTSTGSFETSLEQGIKARAEQP